MIHAGCGLGDEGVIALTRVLRTNTTITTLELNGTPVACVRIDRSMLIRAQTTA
jgi:hypothetical protein